MPEPNPPLTPREKLKEIEDLCDNHWIKLRDPQLEGLWISVDDVRDILSTAEPT